MPLGNLLVLMRRWKTDVPHLEDPIFSSEWRHVWILEKDMIQGVFADFSDPLERRIRPRVRSADCLERVPCLLLIEKTEKFRVGSKQLFNSRTPDAAP